MTILPLHPANNASPEALEALADGSKRGPPTARTREEQRQKQAAKVRNGCRRYSSLPLWDLCRA